MFSASLVAENPGQQWSTFFDGRGFTVTPESGGWTWGLELRRYGFSGAERTVGKKAGVSHERGRVHYDWNAKLREWFINDARGLEQGWILTASAEIRLRVRGNLKPSVSPQSGDESVTIPTPNL